MSLHFLSGKPGGGKSYFALKLLVDELRNGRRAISTNLPLVLPELANYLHERYDDTFDMLNRIRVLTQEETAQFWLHPCKGVDLTDTVTIRVREKLVTQVDYSKRPAEGTLFMIDEIHLYFNARSWQSTGEDCTFYISQHRKLGDDVIAITQHVGNVDKQFRSMTQDYTYLRNMMKEKIGIFRSVPVIMRSTFAQPATGAPGEKAMETGVFRLDVTGLCKCYDTAAGVGIVSRSGGDTKERKKGLAVGWLIMGVLLVAIGLAMVPRLIAYSVGKSTTAPKQKHNETTNSAEVVTQRNILREQNTNKAASSLVKETDDDSDNGPELSVVGSAMLRGRWTVWLSDGSRLTQGDDPSFTSLNRSGIVVDGKHIKWKTETKTGLPEGEKKFRNLGVPNRPTLTLPETIRPSVPSRPGWEVGTVYAPRPNVTLRNN